LLAADAYLSTPALFDQLREAQRTVSYLIVRSAGENSEERLTRLLLAEVRGGAVSQVISPEYPIDSRNLARRPIEKKGGARISQSERRSGSISQRWGQRFAAKGLDKIIKNC
jgi:hypothetical protein